MKRWDVTKPIRSWEHRRGPGRWEHSATQGGEGTIREAETDHKCHADIRLEPDGWGSFLSRSETWVDVLWKDHHQNDVQSGLEVWKARLKEGQTVPKCV